MGTCGICGTIGTCVGRTRVEDLGTTSDDINKENDLKGVKRSNETNSEMG